MSDSVEYFGIKCHECGFVGSSEEAHGGKAMADSGDFEELRCPKCEWVTLHEDPRDSELCDEIVRLRKIVEALTTPPVVTDPKPQGEVRDYDDLLESFIEIAKQRTIERKALRAIIEALKGNTDKAELIAIACDALDGKAVRVPPEATPRKERNKP